MSDQLDFDDLLQTEAYLSVSRLTREIKLLLESSFPNVLVQGEISNFTHHSSGHMYFSLKDEFAQIPCVMWRSNNQNLFFAPQDGMKVLVKARVSLYEKRGAYQLDVWHLQPAGIGELQLAFEQLKKRLRAEGLFSPEFKKPLPRFPQRIGIVTSPTGAAIRDLVTVLQRRFPAIEIVLNPVRVQGEGAAREIARAVDEFNEYGQVDVLIVARGGGSLEDLWPFNEEPVARAVFRSRIPVISAVGHEVDFSICDFVADVRAATPSAAAEIAVPSREELKGRVQQFSSSIATAVLEKVKYQREKLRAIEKSYAFRQPLDIVRQHSQRTDDLRRNLQKSIDHKIELRRQIMNSLQKRLALLGHKNVLKRGYSLCTRQRDGKLVSRADQLAVEERIVVEFYAGKAVGTVEELET
ncbi:MAG: exodeoxyribonuclease VII large subunit [bacterium]